MSQTQADRGDPIPRGASPLRGQAWRGWFSEAVRFVIAPFVLLFSGFFTTDFLLSGFYTWPRTSRIVALTLTVAILSYEFVYKEQRARQAGSSDVLTDAQAGDRARNALLYSCVIPYVVGGLALLVLVRLA